LHLTCVGNAELKTSIELTVSSALGVMIGHDFEIYLTRRLSSSEKATSIPKLLAGKF